MLFGLKNGDYVALIAPSGIPSISKVHRGIENIKALQLNPIAYDGEKIVQSDEAITAVLIRKYGYLAGSDQRRLSELHWAFADNKVKAIFAIRGGYGATRLLPFINYSLIAHNPKILIGYSDITAIQMALYHRVGLQSLHGIVAGDVFTDYHFKQLRKFLFGELKSEVLDCYEDKDFSIIVPGEAYGVLVGGNLSLLSSLVGTGFLPSFAGKIVFIEDIAEPIYKIDRMLEHLLQGTDLSFASAFVFGEFTGIEPQKNDFELSELLYEKFGNMGVPVIMGVNFGHITNKCIFPIGVEVFISTNPFEVRLVSNIYK